MATYVMSDIHGEYEQFLKILEMIDLQDDDTLYILGDVVDRGQHPIKVLLKMMEMPNVYPIIGNHEHMALDCLQFLCNEVNQDSIDEFEDEYMMKLMNWKSNGASTTINEFSKLDLDTRKAVLDYLGNFSLYETITINHKEYILVHSGLGRFEEDKPLDEYDLYDLVWQRCDYSVPYYKDKYVITGHTPTQAIYENERKGYIYQANNHIAIDCGACFNDGRLACLCLDTMEEFYSR